MSKPETVDDLLNLARNHEVPVIGLLVAQAAEELIKRNVIALDEEADIRSIIKIHAKIGHPDFMAPETAMLILSRPGAVDEAMSWIQTFAK